MAKLSNRDLRQDIIETCRKMNAIGINQGTAGNVSARIDEGLLITPTGIPYDVLEPADIATLYWDASYSGRRQPSSEWRFHYDIMKARPDSGAIIHTHALHCTVLACMRMTIPSFHYMIAVAGGYEIRCADYARFGTQDLSDNAITALDGLKACLLANHGMIVMGDDLNKALALAVEVETLASQYWRCLQVGKPHILSKEQMDEVLMRVGSYGKHPDDLAPGAMPALDAPPKRSKD